MWALAMVFFLVQRGDPRRVVVKSIRERDSVERFRQRRVDDEAHGHCSRFVTRKVLRYETKALGLAEERRGLAGRHRRHRLRDGVAAGEVMRDVVDLVEPTGVHFHFRDDGLERPAAHRGQFGDELDRHKSVFVGRLHGHRGGLQQILRIADTRDLAEHVVERDQGETECERAHRHAEQLMRQPTVAALHGDAGFVVKSAVKRTDLPTLIPLIKAKGGTDIVVSAISNVIP